MRRTCLVYSGLLPARFSVPGAVLAPVRRGVVFVDRGVDGPPERRLTCFVRAMIVEVGGVQDMRETGQSALGPKKGGWTTMEPNMTIATDMKSY